MRLIKSHADWVLGFEDETWWSRFAHPYVYAWTDGEQPLPLVEQAMDKADTEPKALACYGLLVLWANARGGIDEQVWLRFVDGRPLSAITIEFLKWCCSKLEAANRRVLLMVWDNASWHISRALRQWIREHNLQVKRTAQGVRILACALPVKSPWLNPIEPKWVHAKRRVVEPTRALRATELAQRVCATFNCAYEQHLSIPEYVA